MYNTIFFVIIAIIVLDFLFERILDYLNSTRWSQDVPVPLRGVYNAEQYRKSQNYYRENLHFGYLTSSFSFLLILLMLIFGGFALVNEWAFNMTSNTILAALVFFAILGLGMDVLTTPFALYDTFVIEEKYGFNKSTLALFFTDKLKGWLLSAVLGGGLMALIIWFYQATGKWFWILAWGLVTVFLVFMTVFYSTLIVPIFNKQTPLEQGTLREQIHHLCKKVGFKLDDVYIIDGSKRSTKANAYFSGLGRKKRIVLFDTLVEDLTTEEIVAVLAHEIGHYRKKHTLTGIILSVLQVGLTLFVLSLFIKDPALSEALGVSEPFFHVGLVAFGILYAPISTILGLGMNMVSRRHEFEADAFARRYYDGRHLASGLKKLSVKNLSNLNPHPLYVFFHYSHPPLLERLKRLEQD
jgi:STE24 endopeptidase